jgi:hypothetical protein
MLLPIILTVSAALFATATATADEPKTPQAEAQVANAAAPVAPTNEVNEFETPPDEPPAASLAPEEVSGPNFHVVDPVHSDGLMRHYVVESHFGDYHAYGHLGLKVRLTEVTALTAISKKTDVGEFTKAVGRHIEEDVKTVAGFATNPVRTIVGIPKGIVHLLTGYSARAKELTEPAKKGDGSPSKNQTTDKVQAEAARYADRYLGMSAAERRYYQELKVDPYTNNEVLRKAVHHFAKVDVTAGLAMKFSVPGIPFAGDIGRVMDAVYNEDPAVLRARRRQSLLAYGLDPAEIDRFEHNLHLSPTRQLLIEESAKSMDQVDGRGELFRHAAAVTSDEESQVFVQSAVLLARLHAKRPVARILPGLRLPSAQFADGRVVVCAAFDDVYWTQEIAGLRQDMRAGLPDDGKGLELWLGGRISPLARSVLASRGWDVHDDAIKALVPSS